MKLPSSAPFAMLTNQSSLAESGLPVALDLKRRGERLVKIFSPEHGFSAQAEDGKAQHNGTEPLTGLPLVSLYGDYFRPSTADLQDVDYVLVDLPNIGCRFYTYWWTITHMAEACADVGKPLVLVDRPNLSGRSTDAMEGPMLDENHCSSFLGRWTMPLTYAQRYAELLPWFLSERAVTLDFSVIAPGQAVNSHIPRFVPPSPAIPNQHTTLIYPCTALFEGLNVNCGRGTSFPFFVIGAPWIDSIKLFSAFREMAIPGLSAIPYSYKPEWSVYAKQYCHGLYFQVENAQLFRPVYTGLRLMNYLSIAYPDQLKEELYPTAANASGEHHLDRLLGVQDSFQHFCSRTFLTESRIAEITNVQRWNEAVNSFSKNL